jgi:cobaltochelatase CobT
MQTKTMVALAETCELANVPLNILGFSDYVMPLKKWNDSMVRSRGVLGGQRTINGTQIVSAVFEGIRALAGRKESKKILIVMTDGSIGSDRLRVQSLIAFTKKHHPEIEIYGLGMGVDLRSVFPKGGQVDSTNMAQTVLNILAQ